MAEMQKQKGLYCAIGIITKGESYRGDTIKRFGWAEPNNKTIMVDFGGHSWFCEKEWLNYLFEDTNELQNFKICAEDMTFSCKLQQHNIKTFVPPQPKNNKDFSGSIKGLELGEDKESLYLNNGWEKMSFAFDKLIKEYHFKTIEKSDYKYFKKTYKPLPEIIQKILNKLSQIKQSILKSFK